MQFEPTSVWFRGHKKKQKNSLSGNEMSRISENTMQVITNISARSPSFSVFWVDEFGLPEQTNWKGNWKDKIGKAEKDWKHNIQMLLAKSLELYKKYGAIMCAHS